MTPRIIGKMVLMVLETSLTEFSIPPIWAKLDAVTKNKKSTVNNDFFIGIDLAIWRFTIITIAKSITELDLKFNPFKI